MYTACLSFIPFPASLPPSLLARRPLGILLFYSLVLASLALLLVLIGSKGRREYYY